MSKESCHCFIFLKSLNFLSENYSCFMKVLQGALVLIGSGESSFVVYMQHLFAKRKKHFSKEKVSSPRSQFVNITLKYTDNLSIFGL